MKQAHRRVSFGARLTATVLVTVAAIGTVQYVVVARTLRRRVVAQETAMHSADATVLADLYESAPHGQKWAPVNELLNHIATRPGIRQVTVIDPHGVVVAVGRRGHSASTSHGSPAAMPMPSAGTHSSPVPSAAEHASGRTVGHHVDSPRVARVLAGGAGFARIDDASQDGQTLVVVPVGLSGGRHALEVVKSGDALLNALADLRILLLVTLGVGLGLAAPLFHLVGGRSLSARHQTALERSSRDGLTGLRNHRTFHEELRRAMAEATRHATPLALALVDLDGFKAVNDTRGHRAGDRVLSRVANILSAGRPGDVTFRVGGDEFAVLMPMTALEGATVATDRLRRAVEEAALGVTTSVGVAILRPDMRLADHLIDAADSALYRAKTSGRNRVAGPAELDATQPAVASPVT